MKVAIYCRVSTDLQNTDNQEQICLEYCKRHGFEVYGIYKDTYTGTSDNRPEFNKLMRDMRWYKFSAIVVTKLDRLTRSLKHLLSLADEFKIKGVDIVATNQNIDTTSAMGKAFFQLTGVFSELERNLIADRTKDAFYTDSEGIVRSRKTGKAVGKRGRDKKPRQKRGVLRKAQKQAQMS